MIESPGGEPPLLAAFRMVDLTARDVWLRYLALGGAADEVSVAAQLHGFLDLPAGQFNVLAHALNEELDDRAAAYAAAKVPLRPVGAREGLRGRDR